MAENLNIPNDDEKLGFLFDSENGLWVSGIVENATEEGDTVEMLVNNVSYGTTNTSLESTHEDNDDRDESGIFQEEKESYSFDFQIDPSEVKTLGYKEGDIVVFKLGEQTFSGFTLPKFGKDGPIIKMKGAGDVAAGEEETLYDDSRD